MCIRDSAWGVGDKDLFKAISAYMDQHRGEKILNVIMTTSNHPPYSINVGKEGYDVNKVKGHLPDSIEENDKQLNEMGHIWYADPVSYTHLDVYKRQNLDRDFDR